MEGLKEIVRGTDKVQPAFPRCRRAFERALLRTAAARTVSTLWGESRVPPGRVIIGSIRPPPDVAPMPVAP